MDKLLLEDLHEYCSQGGTQAELEDAIDRLLWRMRQELESHQYNLDQREPPSRWDSRRESLYKTLQGLDPRMVAQMNQLSHNLYPNSPNSVYVMMLEVLRDPFHKEATPQTQDIKYVCMMMVAGFCKQWGMSVEKTRLCGFYVLMDYLLPELGLDWDIYKLADIATPLHDRLFNVDLQ